ARHRQVEAVARARAAAGRDGRRGVTEHELRGLAAHVDFPAERDLAPAVRARLSPHSPRRRRALVLVLAAALLAIAVAFAVPPARSGILRFLHLEGVTIEYVDKLP